MVDRPKSLLLPIMAAAVFAGLGRMVFQKLKADRAARQTNVAGDMDEKTRAWISDVVRTPRE
ncbi:hypothetical protein [Arthrobacter rhizosphaerae]|uniref:hypothetical protein n=1 Tax=Arthrobacter rhizosphaerae TaxID=2855490 RepID=UPI001FF52486|nr:hypothetical protein [Arthrobacter rhizosphaerae]